MDAQTERGMVSYQLTTFADLVPHLDIEGLHLVRGALRHADTIAVCQGSTLLGMRAATLEAVCERLVAAGRAERDYFVSVGDMAPECPDSPESLC